MVILIFVSNAYAMQQITGLSNNAIVGSLKSLMGCKESLTVLFPEVVSLMTAIKNNDLVIIKKYLAKEDDIFDGKIPDDDGCNILMYAIKHGSADTVMFLLQNHEFYLKERDYSGHTALMYAADNKAMSCVVVKLLSLGVDIDQLDNKNRNALMYAVHQIGNYEVVNLLLHSGVYCGQIDNSGFSVFEYAIINKNIAAIKVLLAAKIGFDYFYIKHAIDMVVKEIVQLDGKIIENGEAIGDAYELHIKKPKELVVAIKKFENMQLNPGIRLYKQIKNYGLEILRAIWLDDLVDLEDKIAVFAKKKAKIPYGDLDRELVEIELVIHEMFAVVRQTQASYENQKLFFELKKSKNFYEDVIDNYLEPRLQELKKLQNIVDDEF